MPNFKSLPEINYIFWLFQTVSMMLTAWLVPGLKVVNPIGAFLMVLALAFVNSHIWDAALFFEIPDSLTSHTLTLLIANGIIFWILVKVLPYIEISGLLSALVAPVIYSLLSIGIGYAAEHIDWVKTLEEALKFIDSLKASLLQSSEKKTLLHFDFFS